jgi:hypothetical protein
MGPLGATSVRLLATGVDPDRSARRVVSWAKRNNRKKVAMTQIASGGSATSPRLDGYNDELTTSCRWGNCSLGIWQQQNYNSKRFDDVDPYNLQKSCIYYCDLG